MNRIVNILKGNRVRLLSKAFGLFTPKRSSYIPTVNNSTVSINLFPSRIEIINYIIATKGFTKYLEIGVRNPKDCFDKIQCDLKKSVDPGVEYVENPVNYKYTSDDFFHKLQHKQLDLPHNFTWDVIFIDGLHLANQVERDILNSINHLSPNGFIVVHDCNPFLYDLDYERVIEDFWGQQWNGTVWKVIYSLLCSRGDLDVFTIDLDEGLGIIRRGGGRKLLEHTNKYYEYKILQENLKKHLNCISIEAFLSLMNAK
jgi:hypothetical protein